MIDFGPGDYAGIAYGSTTFGTWGMYAGTIFARVYIYSGTTPSKTIVDFIGMYGSLGDPFDHNYAIPPDGEQPFTGPAVTWQWAGLVNGKPRIWMHDGRPEHNSYAQPRNLFTGGLNGGADHEFILEGSELSEGCHGLCFTWRWTASVLSCEPSECSIWVDGVRDATYNFPAMLSGQPGWFEAIDATKASATIGGTRDTGGVIPDSGTIRLGEVFLVKSGSTPAEITEAQVLSYYLACPGPGSSPAPNSGYPLTTATDLDDSIFTRDLTVVGGTLTTASACPCPDDEEEDGVDDDGGDPTIPCCEDGGPTGGGDTGTNPDPVGPLPPWEASCTGGGVVDGVSDLSDGESWL